MDDDVVVDQLDLLATRNRRGGAGEQPAANSGDGDTGDSQRRRCGDDVRDCETAFHAITFLSSFCHDAAEYQTDVDLGHIVYRPPIGPAQASFRQEKLASSVSATAFQSSLALWSSDFG